MIESLRPDPPVGTDVVIHHGDATSPEIRVERLVDMHEKDGVDFPVDGDASTKQGGTSFGINQEVDK